MDLAKASNLNKLDKENLHEYVRVLDDDVRKLFQFSQARVRFGDGTDGDEENVSGKFQSVADSGVAGVEFSITHTLGAVPVGFFVTKINKGGIVYDSGTTWTSTTVYFKCTASSAAITVYLLK